MLISFWAGTPESLLGLNRLILLLKLHQWFDIMYTVTVPYISSLCGRLYFYTSFVRFRNKFKS